MSPKIDRDSLATLSTQADRRTLPSSRYFGPLSLDFFFHVFFFMRYSKMLEDNTFSGRKADYVWMLTVSGTLLLVRS